MARTDLGVQIAALATMSLAQLRGMWPSLTDKPLPRVKSQLLRLAMAYELQAATYGDLSRKTRQRLDQLAGGKTDTRQAQPGMRLAREWNGVLHVVNIDEAGTVHWDGKSWGSLSKVARQITGTRWSGPAFFGLKENRKVA